MAKDKRSYEDNLKDSGIAPSTYNHSRKTTREQRAGFVADLIETTQEEAAQRQTQLISDVLCGMRGPNFIMHWMSEPNATYQIQRSYNAAEWENVGAPIIGTGAPMSYAEAGGAGDFFLRVLEI